MPLQRDIGVYTRSQTLNIVEGFLVLLVLIEHQVGDHQGCRMTETALSAVHKCVAIPHVHINLSGCLSEHHHGAAQRICVFVGIDLHSKLE